jgi:copper transport protein
VLTAGQPAMERRFVAAPSTPQDRVVAIQSVGAADLQESLSVRPNRPGNNVAIVEVFDTRRPALAPITGVLVRPDGAAYLRSTALGGGRWSVPFTLDQPGPVRLAGRVQRDGMVTDHSYVWVVGGGAATTQPATISTAPIAGVLTGAAGTLGGGLLIVSIAVAVLRRRRSVEPDPDLAPVTPGTG